MIESLEPNKEQCSAQNETRYFKGNVYQYKLSFFQVLLPHFMISVMWDINEPGKSFN